MKNSRIRYFAKLLWLPFLLLKDYAEKGDVPNLKAIIRWLKDRKYIEPYSRQS